MPINLKQMSVLVLEDIKPMRDLTKQTLEILGVGRVVTAQNGEQGLEKLKNFRPDVVICDWEMPELDGIEFIRKVRNSKLESSKTIPIIMVSGYNAPERIFEARDAGMTEYIVKPFTAKELAQRISHVINKPRDFIESRGFTGPDRRRRDNPNYKGSERRTDD